MGNELAKNKRLKEDKKIKFEIMKEILPQILVNNNLDNLYLKDGNKAIKKLKEAKSNQKESIIGRLIIFQEFRREIDKLKKLLKSIDEENFLNFKNMYLYYAVSIFEGMINNHLSQELNEIQMIPLNTVNEEILRLSNKQKLGWVLHLTNNKNFIEQKSKTWQDLKKILDLRNFLLHYKPEDADKFDKKDKDFSKNDLLKFIKNCNECKTYLNRIKNKELKDKERRIKIVRKKFLERNKTPK